MKSFGFISFLILLSLCSCTISSKTKQTTLTGFPSSKGFVEIDGTRLNYVVEGKGRPCLVIGSSIYYPRTFSKQLREHLQLYFVDMRWFAKDYSPVNLKDFTLQTIVDDIDKVRTSLKLDKIIIAGHSIHGTIAFEYARAHPDKVSNVIMICSPNNQTNQDQEDAINRMWETASAERQSIMNKNWKILSEMKNLTSAQITVETYCFMAPKYWFNSTYDAHWLWKDMTLNTEILNYLYDGIFKNYYLFKNGRTVPVPTFVAVGKFDYVDPASLWQGYEDVQGLTVKLFEKSGHTPQLEESEVFNNDLLEWISKN